MSTGAEVRPANGSAAGARAVHQPALDGLRAVAVGLVLVFHGGFTWMTGGYVGVSVFFTLSGFLITRLLLVEFDRSGTIAVGAFYGRRLKRLLPASLLCLGVVAVLAARHQFDYAPGVRRDLLGSLFQVENWVKLGSGRSYADLTNATVGRLAPLEHYWSLAIEEQFYWIWPLAMLALLRRVRSSARRTVALGALALLASLAAPLIAHVWGANAAYWATPARSGEILIGAALAGLLVHRPQLTTTDRVARWLPAIGALCLGVIVWAAVTWPSSGGPAYAGALPLFAMASAGLILGIQGPSPLARLLSLRPVVWLGAVSYGLYLFHWPVFALATSSRIGTDGWRLFAVRLAITLAITTVSFYVLEQPIRRWTPTWRFPVVAGVALTGVVALLVAVVVPVPHTTTVSAGRAAIQPASAPLPALAVVPAAVTPTTGVVGASAPADTLAPTSTSPATTPADTAPVNTAPGPTTTIALPQVTRPVRIMVIGDSTAEYTGGGLAAWATDHPATAQVSLVVAPGCGFIRDGVIPTDGDVPWKATCDALLDQDLPQQLTSLRPDVAVLMVTLRDVEDRQWSSAEGLLSPLDPRFRARMKAAYEAMAQRLVAGGVHRIVWIRPPLPAVDWEGAAAKMANPARYQVQADVIAEVAAELPDVVRILDMNAWLDSIGGAHDMSLRPDGLHWTPDVAKWISEVYLGPSVVSLTVS